MGMGVPSASQLRASGVLWVGGGTPRVLLSPQQLHGYWPGAVIPVPSGPVGLLLRPVLHIFPSSQKVLLDSTGLLGNEDRRRSPRRKQSENGGEVLF